jgi:hypothetical protein
MTDYQWSGMAPRDIVRLLDGFERTWWIAGGYSIDLALGRETRTHADLDLALLRGDEVGLDRLLPEWEFHIAHVGEFERWDGAAPLRSGRHQFWLRRDAAGPWDFEILLEDHDGAGAWQYRRDARITLPVERLGTITADGVPHLSLELALLYKAKGQEAASSALAPNQQRWRAKNALDFDAALPALDQRQRRWLADAIAVTWRGHPWLARLG